MSAPTLEQLQSELTAIFRAAPPALHGNTRLAVPDRPRSQNAMQHGLSGQQVLVSADDIHSFARMGLEYIRELKPVGALETGNAQLYLEDRWRLHRILAVENDLFYIARPQPDNQPDAAHSSLRKPGFARQVNAFREEARNMDLISRYETRLMRNSGRLMEEIRALRSERAKTDPCLVYDEQTDPAAAWYSRILAQAERIAEASEQPAGQEEPAPAAIQGAAIEVAAPQNPDPAESTTSSETSFGKNPSSAPNERPAPVEWPQTTPQWDKNPPPKRDLQSARSTTAA